MIILGFDWFELFRIKFNMTKVSEAFEWTNGMDWAYSLGWFCWVLIGFATIFLIYFLFLCIKHSKWLSKSQKNVFFVNRD